MGPGFEGRKGTKKPPLPTDCKWADWTRSPPRLPLTQQSDPKRAAPNTDRKTRRVNGRKPPARRDHEHGHRSPGLHPRPTSISGRAAPAADRMTDRTAEGPPTLSGRIHLTKAAIENRGSSHRTFRFQLSCIPVSVSSAASRKSLHTAAETLCIPKWKRY